ncbi:hypothetical protein SEETLT22_14611 [Salmonella enterica subsp. enterica serovar Typhimurium str. LT2-4]|nr:hypothetical protein SEETLT21_18495 [Salmonella enterica subsp. enterica serovar Typhimurium str. LT2-4_delta.ramA::kan]ELX60122.1 hypothetical protein SEETLT22_14611 [Salmonella enterica subsp. enterica serovar Typhimurium str. LT2-4]
MLAVQVQKSISLLYLELMHLLPVMHRLFQESPDIKKMMFQTILYTQET